MIDVQTTLDCIFAEYEAAKEEQSEQAHAQVVSQYTTTTLDEIFDDYEGVLDEEFEEWV